MTVFEFDRARASDNVQTCWQFCKAFALCVGTILLCLIGVGIFCSPFAALPCTSVNHHPSTDETGLLGLSVPFAFLLAPMITLCQGYGYQRFQHSDNFEIWSAHYRFFKKTFFWLTIVVPFLAYAGFVTISVCVCTSTLPNQTAAIAQFLIVCGQLTASLLLFAVMQLFDCSKPYSKKTQTEA